MPQGASRLSRRPEMPGISVTGCDASSPSLGLAVEHRQGPGRLGRGGVWYLVERGMRNLLVPDERGLAVCYVIYEPASHDYWIMTGAGRMPMLIGQRI